VHFIMIGAAPLSDDLSKQLDAILPGVSHPRPSLSFPEAPRLTPHPSRPS
jgi:hypothetical protein